MKPFKKILGEKIVKAAELRAGGVSWATVASQVGRSIDTVTHWPRTYPKEWQAALAEAEKAVSKELTGESLLILRQMLRDEDPKFRRDAARLLLHNNHEERKVATNDYSFNETDSAEMLKVAAELEKIDDAQLDSLVANLLEELAAEATGDSARKNEEVGTTQP